MLRICALYPDLMNIYADRGNLLMLERRCAWRGIGFRVDAAGIGDEIDPDAHDLFYLGGGQDRDQRLCALDLVSTKREALHAAAARGAIVLGVCGGYQLLGHRYELGDDGDPGARPRRPRDDPLDRRVAADRQRRDRGAAGRRRRRRRACSPASRTTAAAPTSPAASSRSGACSRATATRGSSGVEGVRRGSVIGTYLHGPLLPKNAWFADWLIRQATGLDELEPLDDALEDAAHAEARRAAGV